MEKCNIKKRNLNSGEGYEIEQKGKMVKKPPKVMKPPCREKCTDTFKAVSFLATYKCLQRREQEKERPGKLIDETKSS